MLACCSQVTAYLDHVFAILGGLSYWINTYSPMLLVVENERRPHSVFFERYSPNCRLSHVS
ncbi:hypothetical protein BCR39DRAFT_551776, partial [Naematelia encephala]